MCHVPGPRGSSLGYFCPSRASSQCFSQASGASRSQHRLSSFSFLLTTYGSRACNAVGCANTNEHRPANRVEIPVSAEFPRDGSLHAGFPRDFRGFSAVFPCRGHKVTAKFPSRKSRLIGKNFPFRGNSAEFLMGNRTWPTNTRSGFSAPEAVLSKVEQRFDCVQAQRLRLTCIRVWSLEFGGALRSGPPARVGIPVSAEFPRDG